MNDGDSIMETNFDTLSLFNRGKVRDIYDLGENLLIVATDRISAYDCILGSAIPQKGRVLTSLTLFWLDYLEDLAENHLITADPAKMGEDIAPYADAVRGRSMLVKKADVIPIECVVRGYLAGSGWREYQQSGTVCGLKLPKGLRRSEMLPEPVFTPSTKAESGHDENISMERAGDIIGAELAEMLRERSIEIYARARDYAREKGIIVCDTKFEWGFCDGNLTLIDEVLTPDSSRFWPADSYAPGRAQNSFDKQYVRDWLDESGWDHTPPGPSLPGDVIEKTSQKYMQACRLLTGKSVA